MANELVLLSADGRVAHALNESAARIWELCDGARTPVEILTELRARYGGNPVEMLADLTEALFRFQEQGLVDLGLATRDERAALAAATPPGEPRVRFVFGVEDKPYFHWQLAILFESLAGQLAPGWDITVVVCNDRAALSAELTRLIEVYGVRALTGDNHARSHKIDFSAHAGGYVALNRVEALKVIAPHVAADDVVCLMDTDLFLYGELQEQLFPTGNAMAKNEIVGDRLFLGIGSEEHGVDLQKLLAAVGCQTELKRGGVVVFMTGATIGSDKVIKDCFRFAQILYLLGKAAGLPDANVWMAEMACFAMALTANQIDYELLDTPQFATPMPQSKEAPPGSFFHYYVDYNDGSAGPFWGSQWHKQLFYERSWLAENLESFRQSAQSDLERRFFDLSIATRKRLLESPAS